MNDERVRRILQTAEQPLAPAPEFVSELLQELKQELGFPAPTRGGIARPRVVAQRPLRRFDLLLVAALVALGAALVPAIGALRDDVPPLPLDALAEIRRTGRIRIAIRPDHPQFTVGSPAGFDADVAHALAGELDLSSAVVVVDAPAMLAGRSATWDVGLPSTAAWKIDERLFELSVPYYHWPHRVVVPEGSTAATVADLEGERICAVAGGAGEAWLAGRYGVAPSSPIATAVVTRATDAECLEALVTGEAAAVITERLSDAELEVRAGIRVVGGPDPEPRVVIVPRQVAAGPSELLGEINTAIEALRRAGTLTELSQSRFGGDDLSVR